MIRYAIRRFEEMPDAVDWLHPAESLEYQRFSVEKRKRDWLLGRWTAKTLLKSCWLPEMEISALRIKSGENREPHFLEGDTLQPYTITISHGHGQAFCATARKDVLLGCDLEQVRDRSRFFLSDYFSRNEKSLEEKTDLESPVFFTLCWSAKESVMKALKLGMKLHPKKIELVSLETGKEGWKTLIVRNLVDDQLFYGKWIPEGELVYVIVSDVADFELFGC